MVSLGLDTRIDIDSYHFSPQRLRIFDNFFDNLLWPAFISIYSESIHHDRMLVESEAEEDEEGGLGRGDLRIEVSKAFSTIKS